MLTPFRKDFEITKTSKYWNLEETGDSFFLAFVSADSPAYNKIFFEKD